MTSLQTGIQQPLQMNDRILLQVRFGALRIHDWFGIVFHLADNIQLGTLYIYHMIYGISLLEQKVLLWISQPPGYHGSTQSQ